MATKELDIVILGSGAGGWAAALTAAERGARVTVYEKNNSIGGLSNYPAGLFAVESNVQKRLNIPISRDQIFKVFMQRTRWQANARLIKTFIDKSASTIEWLQ
jgi:fumarate reductase flavoprotein subunit